MREILDIRTLSITTSFIYLIIFLNLFQIKRKGKDYPGLGYWSSAYLINFFAFLLQSFRHYFPDFFTIVVANTAIIVGYLFIVRGLVDFSEAKQENKLDSIFSIAVFLLFAVYTYYYPDINARIVIVSLSIATISFRAVSVMKKHISPNYKLHNPLLSGSFLVVGMYSVIRTLYTLFMESRIGDFMSAGLVHSLAYIIISLGHISIFTGLIAMSALRVEGHLDEANDELKTLAGLLPICASCKKIRDDKGYWNQIESYISTHSDAKFSHGLCPECSEKLYGTEDWFKDMDTEHDES